MITLIKSEYKEETLNLEQKNLMVAKKFTDDYSPMTPLGEVKLLEQALNEIIGYKECCCC